MAELLTLFWIFCKIGLFTIGGGMAMLPLVQQELVRRGLMTMSESVDMVAISQMTPDMAATDLQMAQAALGEITGDRADEKLLDEVFSRFCVGK